MIQRIAYHPATWPATVDRIRAVLGAPDNPDLFPPHFLKAAFPKIGGRVVALIRGSEITGYGFLFPHRVLDGQRQYLLQPALLDAADPGDVAAEISASLAPDSCIARPDDPDLAAPSSAELDGWHLGRPSQEEAAAIRAMQCDIWGSTEDYLYPAAMHACFGGPAISTVIRVDNEPAAFLIGFTGFTDPDLPGPWRRFAGTVRLESQLLGVSPAYRGRGLGVILKKYQGLQAAAAGIGVVNWTADPLQFRNAGLNFRRLGAVAFTALPDYMPFENDLNRTAPSRLTLTWLVKSSRVGERLSGAAAPEPALRLSEHPDIVRINQGWDRADLTVTAERIAFEIPADWTAMQKDEPDLALRWRRLTDWLFVRYLGSHAGGYMITGVGEDGDKKYLIAERVSDALLQRLAQ